MIHKKIKEILVGTEGNIYLLCKDIQERESTRGKYLQYTLFDGTDEIKAFHWDTSLETKKVNAGTVIAAVLQVSTYKDSISYTVKNCRKTIEGKDDYKISQFIPEIEESLTMYEDIREKVQNMENEEIKALLLAIWKEKEAEIKRWTASKTVHHNIKGGLVYHIYRMVEMAERSIEVYPILNRDLLIAGCILHDIGKLEELTIDDMGISDYSIDGSLVGHIIMGCDLVKEIGTKLGTDPEVIRLLRHLIASHHGKIEYGAAALPAIPEAFVLNEIDMIDSRMYQLEASMEQLEK